ncbi:MAG: branched-chain amino acid aminotransferase [Alphaproteobacteria bacterium]|nr:branched-chain amino acid aminotransferase [Alphaproteobacteria bacterium]
MSLVPFDDRDGFIWMNGEFIQWRDANLHALSHALHYASAVFEGERAYDGEIFKLREHTERLVKSAEILDFEIPFSMDEIDAASKELLLKNNIKDGYLRPIAWRGSEQMGVSAQATKINVMIAAWEWPAYFTPEAKMAGLKMRFSDWKRPAPDTAPTNSKAAGLYMICTLSKHKAEREGFDDALMLDYRGYVAEATGANIFFLMDDGKIHTPKPDCFLDGITRRTAIDLAKRAGYEIVERHIKPEEMKNASEAFLTGTAVEITPIQSIGEDYKFTPAALSKYMIEAYDAEVHGREYKASAA